MSRKRSPFVFTLLLLIPAVFLYQILIVLVAQWSDLAGPQVKASWTAAVDQQQCLAKEMRQRVPEHDSVFVGNGSTSLLAVELAIVATPDYTIVSHPQDAQWTLSLAPSASGCNGLALRVERGGVK